MAFDYFVSRANFRKYASKNYTDFQIGLTIYSVGNGTPIRGGVPLVRHRTLSVKKFVNTIHWDLLRRYFEGLSTDRKPIEWAFINADAMQQFLADPQNASASTIVLEDFRRINDICGNGMNLLFQAFRHHGEQVPRDMPDLEISMRLFLDRREAFEYAWSRYLIYSCPSMLTFYHLQCPLIEIGSEQVESFRSELTSWFSNHGKGESCHVNHFEDQGEHVFLISRGSYMRTVAYWQQNQIEFTSFRPASEDVVVYAPRDSRLTIQASLPGDRKEYLIAFALCLANDPRLVDSAMQSHMFSLAPFQDGTFDYAGDGIIASVTLVKVGIKLGTRRNSIVHVKSEDVLETLEREFKGLSLKSGELVSAGLKFVIAPEGEKPTAVTVDIEPPARTNLAQKRFSAPIDNYLKLQGVRVL